MSEYSLSDAARLFKISRARLRYWERTELLQPRHTGHQLAFGFTELRGIKNLLSLLREGVSLRRIRRNVEAARATLPEVKSPLGSLRPWLEGSRQLVIRYGDRLYEPDGQLVLDFPREPAVTAAHPAADLNEGQSAPAWFERGCALDENPEMRDEAVAAYRRAIELDPDFADAHCNLGTLLHNEGRSEQARAAYGAALHADPDHLEAHFNLANFFEESGRDEAALAHYKRAARSDPLYSDAQLSVALLYEKLGLKRKSLEHWRRYLQLMPDGPWAEVARSRLENH